MIEREKERERVGWGGNKTKGNRAKKLEKKKERKREDRRQKI